MRTEPLHGAERANDNRSAAAAVATVPDARRLIRLPEVMRMTGLGRSAIYEAMSRGEFDRPVRLTARHVAWRLADIERWIDSRPTAEPRRAA